MSSLFRKNLDNAGLFLVGLILLFTVVAAFGLIFNYRGDSVLAASTSTVVATSSITLTNSAPVFSVISINSSSSITLTANATTAVSVTLQLVDSGGCSDITNGTATIMIYRSGYTSSTCFTSPDNLYCYRATAFTATSSCSSEITVNATATFGVYYFAQPTDSSSSFSAQNWMATAIVKDSTGATSTADSVGVELLNLTALNVGTSSINYGTLYSSSTTLGANQVTPIANAGNVTSTLLLNGTALFSGTDSIATSSQHYATSSFFYGENEQSLQVTATTVSGFLVQTRSSLINDIGSWVTSTAYANTLKQFSAATRSNYIYAVGGYSATHTITSTVKYSQVDTTGSIGSWNLTTALPVVLADTETVIYNGYMYVLGGNNTEFSNPTSTVIYTSMNSTGSINSWSNTTALPLPLQDFGAVANNGYLYTVGGLRDVDIGALTPNVYYAPIGSSGALGSWGTTTELSTALQHHAVVANKNYLYIIGGENNVGTATSAVQYAPMYSSGTIGSWATTTALPTSTSHHTAVVGSDILGDYLYVIGGSNTSTVLYAPINSDGTIGSWATTTPLQSYITDHESVYNNGYLYVLMGTSNVQTSTVKYSSVNNGSSQRDVFWGLNTGSASPGVYSGVNTFTAVYQP